MQTKSKLRRTDLEINLNIFLALSKPVGVQPEESFYDIGVSIGEIVGFCAVFIGVEKFNGFASVREDKFPLFIYRPSVADLDR
jgi:hypothetical protein